MAARRRNPLLRVLAVLVLLLAVVAGVAVLGGNTYGRSWLERQVRDQLTAQLSMTGPPTVELRDQVVVVSVLRQRFDEAHLVLPGLELRQVGPGVRADVDLVVKDVVATRQFTQYTAGSLTGTTTLAWRHISTILGQEVVSAPGGRAALTYSLTIAGAKVTAQVSAKPELDSSGALFLSDPQMSLAGFQVPQSLVQQITEALVKPIPLGLPHGIKATRVLASEAGLTLDLAGTDVDLTGLR